MKNHFQRKVMFVALVVAFLSLLSSCLLLCLLFTSTFRSKFSIFLVTMTIFQILNDVGYFVLADRSSSYSEYIAGFLFVSSFTAVTIWVNLVNWLNLSMMYSLQTVDTHKHYYSFLFMALLPAASWAIYQVGFCAPDWDVVTYSYWRIFLIGMNLIAYLLSTRWLSKIVLSIIFRGSSEEVHRVVERRSHIAHLLSSRLRYYPICQVVTRILLLILQTQNKFARLDSLAGDFSPPQRVYIAVAWTLNPATGIGYFLIYLSTQPSALPHLKNLLARIFLCNDIRRGLAWLVGCAGCGKESVARVIPIDSVPCHHEMVSVGRHADVLSAHHSVLSRGAESGGVRLSEVEMWDENYLVQEMEALAEQIHVSDLRPDINFSADRGASGLDGELRGRSEASTPSSERPLQRTEEQLY